VMLVIVLNLNNDITDSSADQTGVTIPAFRYKLLCYSI